MCISKDVQQLVLQLQIKCRLMIDIYEHISWD